MLIQVINCLSTSVLMGRWHCSFLFLYQNAMNGFETGGRVFKCDAQTDSVVDWYWCRQSSCALASQVSFTSAHTTDRFFPAACTHPSSPHPDNWPTTANISAENTILCLKEQIDRYCGVSDSSKLPVIVTVTSRQKLSLLRLEGWSCTNIHVSLYSKVLSTEDVPLVGFMYLVFTCMPGELP